MQFITFQSKLGPSVGVVRGGEVIPVLGLDMHGVIERGGRDLPLADHMLPLEGLAVLAPLPQPRRNVFCVGLNYVEHAKESAAARGQAVKLPDRPVFFTKATTTVIGPGAAIAVHAQVSTQMDWEAELAVVIGRAGRNIPREHAHDYIFGYTITNDVSARDVQVAHGGQFFKGKSLDATCPLGPALVTPDDLPNPLHLEVTCRVNGVVKQAGNTSDFIFDVPTIIEWLSKGMTLLPGDIIATGTPAGVGFARTPPEFLQPGDVVECAIAGLGTLRNPVAHV